MIFSAARGPGAVRGFVDQKHCGDRGRGRELLVLSTPHGTMRGPFADHSALSAIVVRERPRIKHLDTLTTPEAVKRSAPTSR